MPEKENQHYIPQGYLRGFTILNKKSLVWEYDKESGQISNAPRSIREVCSKHLYYAQEDRDGQIDRQKLENAFQVIEDKAPRIVRGIQPTHTGERVKLSGKDHGALSFFIALLLTRTPSFRDGIEDLHKQIVEKSHGFYVEHACQKGESPVVIKDLYQKGQLFEQIRVTIKPQVSLSPMIQLADNLF